MSVSTAVARRDVQTWTLGAATLIAFVLPGPYGLGFVVPFVAALALVRANRTLRLVVGVFSAVVLLVAVVFVPTSMDDVTKPKFHPAESVH